MQIQKGARTRRTRALGLSCCVTRNNYAFSADAETAWCRRKRCAMRMQKTCAATTYATHLETMPTSLICPPITIEFEVELKLGLGSNERRDRFPSRTIDPGLFCIAWNLFHWPRIRLYCPEPTSIICQPMILELDLRLRLKNVVHALLYFVVCCCGVVDCWIWLVSLHL